MLLAIDIGNTSLSFGLFDGKKIRHHWKSATKRDRTIEEYGMFLSQSLHQIDVKLEEIDACVIASVVPSRTEECAEMSRRYLKREPFLIKADTPTEMRILYDQPNRLGVDRLADVVAACQLYGKPVIVIDFGTATTFNVVDKNGDFQGGAITYGLNTATNALVQAAALLPDFELVFPPKVIAIDTITALQSGALYGYLGLVEGMVRRLQNELGYETTVVATGGLAGIIAEQTNAIDAVNPTLTLEGLQLIWEFNVCQTPVSQTPGSQ